MMRRGAIRAVNWHTDWSLACSSIAFESFTGRLSVLPPFGLRSSSYSPLPGGLQLEGQRPVSGQDIKFTKAAGGLLTVQCY